MLKLLADLCLSLVPLLVAPLAVLSVPGVVSPVPPPPSLLSRQPDRPQTDSHTVATAQHTHTHTHTIPAYSARTHTLLYNSLLNVPELPYTVVPTALVAVRVLLSSQNLFCECT